MLNITELKDGKIKVESSDGMVDIGVGAVPALIISRDELEYVTEVKKEE